MDSDGLFAAYTYTLGMSPRRTSDHDSPELPAQVKPRSPLGMTVKIFRPSQTAVTDAMIEVRLVSIAQAILASSTHEACHVAGKICCFNPSGRHKQQRLLAAVEEPTQRGAWQPFHCAMHAKVHDSVSLVVLLKPLVEGCVLGVRRQVPAPHKQVTSYTSRRPQY